LSGSRPAEAKQLLRCVQQAVVAIRAAVDGLAIAYTAEALVVPVAVASDTYV
jgi:hypothetical protein